MEKNFSSASGVPIQTDKSQLGYQSQSALEKGLRQVEPYCRCFRSRHYNEIK